VEKKEKNMFNKTLISLAELLGEEYTDALVECAGALHGMDSAVADALVHEQVDFYDSERQKHLESMLPQIGKVIVRPLQKTNTGATTLSYSKASNLKTAPMGGLGPYRVGEDGRLYFAAKSEHYHASVGHNFSGYKLVDHARRLGVPNATHNNTRGYITRLMEQELVRCINGIERNDRQELEGLLASQERKVLNRVINLETGSLAVEAGVKMMLTRFFRLDQNSTEPRYSGKIPVFLVMADNDDGLEANYHGTTIFTQMFRGLWPELYGIIAGHQCPQERHAGLRREDRKVQFRSLQDSRIPP
jgi:hypothetical protein